ncbi:aspartic peptidase domain-containing protein [Phakopsora pachyrhizi]|uniref:Aspartic peptidase domain-containing protein n=1 Tax=Phakopsora pachyrhizi TaxID=170000 RepID=A0AAV0AP70_PHAPC|nr:aspartic peptidase domain-containing protein [Phakopsora pachyrhizi]
MNITVVNTIVSYIATVKVGPNGQTYRLIIDTGSSTTWVGAAKSFLPTNPTTDEPFSLTYGSGTVSGLKSEEILSFSDQLTTKQPIGVASNAMGFDDVDGILGLGPVKLTVGSLEKRPTAEVPTVVDNLFTEKKINNKIVGVAFSPSNQTTSSNGLLTFGGVDNSRFQGPLQWIKRTDSQPASNYFGVNMTITAGKNTIMENSAGIVDTGTTLILISQEALQRYMALIPGSKLETGAASFISMPPSSVASVPVLEFDFGTFKATLNPEQQLLPASQARLFGVSPDKRYSFVNSVGGSFTGGLEFILGQKFLEHYYTAYDASTGAVGIAPHVTPSSAAQGGQAPKSQNPTPPELDPNPTSGASSKSTLSLGFNFTRIRGYSFTILAIGVLYHLL